MTHSDTPILFTCAGEQLLGILSQPGRPAATGVLVIVGGPQYRSGSHRQFALLARALAEAGYPVLRFDYRGMGDSSGEPRNFEQIDEDIAAAINAFFQHCPQLQRVALWGLCDAASASLLYWLATRDPRIAGFCLLNPWVRSETTLAQTQIRHYYGQRLLQREFWAKLFSGRLGIGLALSGFLQALKKAGQHDSPAITKEEGAFPQKMARALAEFNGAVLLMLSGEDYTAKEFQTWLTQDEIRRQLLGLKRVTRHDIAAADHTFSQAVWRREVEDQTIAWLKGWERA